MPTEAYEYETWYTGSDQPATTSGTYATGQTIPARTPLGQVTASGEFVAWDPAATDGSEVAVRMSAVDIDTTGGAAKGPMIKGGTYNPELVNWPVGTTDVEKALAFVGTPISLQLPAA